MSRGRPRNILPTDRRKVAMSEELWTRVDLYLFSPLEGCVPHGAYKSFFEEAVTHYFSFLKDQNER